MQEVEQILPVGSIVQNRYIVEGLLGKGGFGAVYLVSDIRVKGNRFALKEAVDPGKKERTRFIFEGELLKQLDHTSLPRVYRIFEDRSVGRVYLLMDYIEGPNLERLRLRQPEKRFPLSQALNLLAPIMDAMMYLCSQQPPIIHRDIKPSNIIVPNSGGEAVLVDFGIAKPFQPESTTTAVRRCSPGYGAPEQYTTGTNTHTDIYGLGATLYTLLTGAVPVDAFTRMSQLSSIRKDPLEPVTKLVPGIPEYVASAIQKAMSVNSEDRFVSVEQFWQALNARPMRQEPPTLILAPEKMIDRQSLARAGSHVSEEHVSLAAVNGAVQPDHLPVPSVQHIRTRPSPTLRKRRKVIPFLLVCAALLVGLGLGTGLWSYLADHVGAPVSLARHTASTVVTSHTPTVDQQLYPSATPTQVHHRPKPTPTSPPAVVPTSAPVSPSYPKSTPTPLPKPTPTPTPTPIEYPNVAGLYTGTIDDITANIKSQIELTIQQNSSKISGFFTVNPPLVGSNPFTGSVTTGKSIQFTVQSYQGNAPLFFWGSLQPHNSMGGQYCSVNSAGQCSSSAGASGTWYATLSSTGGS